MRPIIYVRGELNRELDETLAAVWALEDCGVYVTTHHVINRRPERVVMLRTGETSRPLTAEAVAILLDHAARFMKFGRGQSVYPPRRLVRAVFKILHTQR